MTRTQRIVTVGEIPLDSLRAHAINVIKTSGGFTRLGYETTLLALPPENSTAAEILARMGETGLRVEVPPDEVRNATGDRAVAFGRWAAHRAAELAPLAVYARHFDAACEAAELGLTAILETHAHAGDPNPKLLRALRSTNDPRGVRAVSTISPVLREDFTSRGGHPDRIGVVPDGVDVAMFTPPAHLPKSPYFGPGAHIAYCGHLYDYKGIPTVLNAAAIRPLCNWHLVGGMPEDIHRVSMRVRERSLNHVTLHGHRPYDAVPAYLWHADVLLLPPSAEHASADWTSPVKLGEYLASGRPIVAAAIPGLRTWVDEPAVRWFTPDDRDSLVSAIDDALRESPEHATARRAAARAAAESFSYTRRAASMLELAQLMLAHKSAA